MLSVDSSLIFTMRSPRSSPSRVAGVFGIGRMIVRCPSRIEMTIPSPPNSPRVLICISSNTSGVSRSVCGSRVRSIPLTVVYSMSRSSTSSPSRFSWRNPKHLPEATRERPGAVHVHREVAALVVDLNRQGPRAFLVVHDDRSDRTLDRVEARQEHPLVVDALGLDVVLVDLEDGSVEHLKLSEVVGILVARRLSR